MKKLKVDAGFGFSDEFHNTQRIVEKAELIEAAGFDGLLVSELSHDPFLPLSLVAHHTSTLQIRTSIAVALARSPMTVASMAHDLNAYSQGRFTLGLGSQIKPHIEKRFSMPWHKPAKQMREYISALHAIWDCWYEGKPLNFRGDYYQFRLMSPEFTPTNNDYGRPKVTMAAVGPRMIDTAAAVADGIIVHSFCTEKHYKEVFLPQLTSKLKEHGRSFDDFEIQFPVFVATGENDEEIEKNRLNLKYRVGFYASTPAYRGVLETHGWEDLQPTLNRLTKDGKWDELASHISDDVLDAFSVVGTPIDAAKKLKARFEGVVDRVTLEANLPANRLKEQLSIF